jgi:hypothetical protein
LRTRAPAGRSAISGRSWQPHDGGASWSAQGERILTLAESGGQKTPVTPLLVTLFVESALRRAADRLSFDQMPEAVPEVFVDYLRRLNSSGAKSDGAVLDDLFIRAAQVVASVSLGKNLIPQDFSPQDASEALK